MAVHVARAVGMVTPEVTPDRLDHRRWLFPAGVMLAILVTSSVPGRPLPRDPGLYGLFGWVPPEIQNALHVPVYGMLAWAWCAALLPSATRFSVARLVASTVLTVGVGLLDETYQSLIPGRYSSLADVSLDAVGAIVGVIAFVILRTRRVAAARAARDSRTGSQSERT